MHEARAMTAASGAVTASDPQLRRAARLAADGRLEQAAQLIIAYLREHPEDPRALSQLGQTAIQLGALGQAEHFLRRALARGDRSFETRRALAFVLNQQERLDEAEVLFEQLARESRDPTLTALREIGRAH